ncbi:universal stress protein [Gramella lutea]|uniref:Universal stress protein n=1 Tax=Christiangramia lutea TaxID=1607951 RepID=A0A9X2AAA0_9FLAO|nr:universal stress protein [Christiangramia lutea]MCH4824230.1 universal stress protein [Christiangramia lutea]
MKNILLPTDFSENSVNAIKYGLRLLQNTSCTFFLLHTFTPAAYHSGKAFKNFTSMELVHATREAASEEIRSILDSLKSEFDNPRHKFEWIVDFNLLISKIKSLIKEKKIDYIFMGTQGATGAREIFMGTHTMYTIKKVNCPVLAIPSGTHDENLKEVLFATDYKVVRKTDLETINFFTDLHKARLHVLNVNSDGSLDSKQLENRSMISHFFEEDKPIFHITEGDDIPEAVKKFQRQNHIDLVIMLHKKHTFFENILFKPVINQLVYHTNIPFMVIPYRE